MGYTYTIINTDAKSNLQLQHYMGEYADFRCNGVETDSNEGLNTILKHTSDIVFVHLNDKAFEYFHMIMELHQYLSEIPILIALSTSKDFAYQALKNQFFDYWMLPLNELEVRKTILRLKMKLPKEKNPETLLLQSYKDYRYLNTNEIMYLQADNNTTDFFMKDGSTISAFKTLKTFETYLPPNFIRVHQSYIINTNFVSRINYGKRTCTLKYNKLHLPFSKTYSSNVEQLKQVLSKNAITALN
ncbi:LytR/AlgR family response regulator transcription factor [Arenibacter latericius]|uniref:LytR/AlgR family response regulator transcription factor n=1 Tax=Arenibacter latericius TaxID=86104 RepID=UPI00047AD0CB|nr:LytTR family DNA-binding domain-containing protein [Arenibacter latericius]MDX1362847.1 LytTR family transcriptional regulator DNA-binding domain-containing protein [Arenibacter latericius]